ncbi:substrate-binding domain-containing protein [Aeromonas schubertii]|uniref:Substrate-binding domain-containing protein n=1 Tax=Aeromonas schubertii TaxID=652 RepID=A0ABS7VBT4_9GAMM|nr:substrate-binding domain-containing protein [Aeromonas schubertii]MBZ6066833.1 substrate-binding domain-containing protein [Aeromonas schubertii]
MLRKWWSILFIWSSLLAAQGLVDTSGQTDVVVIPKGNGIVFWQVLNRGVADAARTSGRKIAWRGPPNEQAAAAQFKLVSDYLATSVRVLVLAPSEPDRLRPLVVRYREAGKRVLILDSELGGTPVDGFVGSNNYLAGRQLVKALAPHFPANPVVLVVRYQSGHRSTEARVTGYFDELGALGIPVRHVIAGGTSKGSSYRAVTRQLKSDPSINLVIAANESSTEGAVMAVDHWSHRRVMVAGFDLSPLLLQSLKDGRLSGVIVQDPYQMGMKAVALADALIRGDAIAPVTYTDTHLITPSNLSSESIRALIRQQVPQAE